jgi:excisionase family DNA binding protein
MEPDHRIGLQEVADRLGVHYMTAYRYVRTGRLDAIQVAGEWKVDPDALDSVRVKGPAPRRTPTASRAAAARRLEDRLCATDEAGAWGIVQETLASGATPLDILVDVLAPAMEHVGTRWEAGDLSVAAEHGATAIAQRIVGRLGPRFARPGRRRGKIVIGAPAGDSHSLPVAIAADVVRSHGIVVVELGADTPAASFADAAVAADNLLAVVITTTGGGHSRAVDATIRALRAAVPDTPIVVGGGAPLDLTRATRARADHCVTGNARALVAVIDELSGHAPRGS